MKVLINAYACCPNMGSEPGMAWNWCLNLAKECELYIITEGEFKEQLENAVKKVLQGHRMHFYFNPVTPKIRKMCWNQGDWRFYKYYREWQLKTEKIAKSICEKEKIDIIHQLNMIGFREPGYLWRVSQEMRIPFIWGPVDAKEKFPVSYLEGAKLKDQITLRLKNVITGLQLRFSTRVRKAVLTANCVLSASSNSQQSFKKYFNIDTTILNETGCNVISFDKTRKDKDTFDILWVGKMDFRKKLDIAIRSIYESGLSDVCLHIIGNGDNSKYQKLAKSLNIQNQCKWYGVVSHSEVQKIMRQSDLLLFTSVAEGTPHVVLEAMANSLPIVCHDTCGHGDCVNEDVGIKVMLSTPKKSISEFSNAIKKLHSDRILLQNLSDNCVSRAKELSWNRKTAELMCIYNKIIKKSNP